MKLLFTPMGQGKTKAGKRVPGFCAFLLIEACKFDTGNPLEHVHSTACLT